MAARSLPRTVLSWLVAAASAITMFKMGEVAVFPVRSPEVMIERLQQELNKGPLDKVKDGIWHTTLEVTGNRVPPNMTAEQFIKTHQSDRLHLGGIGPAWFLILITMSGSFVLWYRHAASTRRWWLMHGAIAGLLCLATRGASWKPDWVGLFQRLSFLAVYLWMWTVFLADQREPSEESDTKFGRRVLAGI